jgi:hypothetical protein
MKVKRMTIGGTQRKSSGTPWRNGARTKQNGIRNTQATEIFLKRRKDLCVKLNLALLKYLMGAEEAARILVAD